MQQGNFSEAALLKELKAIKIDDAAIKQLYNSYFKTATSYITQHGGSGEDAEDIFQEVLLTFIQLVQQNKFRGESSIGTFLYAIVRHAWLNELKRKGRADVREEKYEMTQEKIEADASRYMEAKEEKKALFAMIENLGDTCKKILMAFYFENLSMREILSGLHYDSEQAVRNKKHKCLKQLEQVIFANPQLAKNMKSILVYE